MHFPEKWGFSWEMSRNVHIIITKIRKCQNNLHCSKIPRAFIIHNPKKTGDETSVKFVLDFLVSKKTFFPQYPPAHGVSVDMGRLFGKGASLWKRSVSLEKERLCGYGASLRVRTVSVGMEHCGYKRSLGKGRLCGFGTSLWVGGVFVERGRQCG